MTRKTNLLREEPKSTNKNNKCKLSKLTLKLILKRLNLPSKLLNKDSLIWPKINFQSLSLTVLLQEVSMWCSMRSWSSSTNNLHGLLRKSNSQIQVSFKDCKLLTREEFLPTLWKESKNWPKIQRCKFQELIPFHKLLVVCGGGFWLFKVMQRLSRTLSQRRTRLTIWCKSWRDQRMNFKLLKTTSLKCKKWSTTWLISFKRPKATWILTRLKQTNSKLSLKGPKN